MKELTKKLDPMGKYIDDYIKRETEQELARVKEESCELIDALDACRERTINEFVLYMAKHEVDISYWASQFLKNV
jgi:hypothetical protein